MNEDDLDRINELNNILNKAERTLQSAESSFNDGFIESAASRAYYAAFHAIQAVLASVNQAYSKHSAVIAQFQRQFVKTGIFPSKLGKALKLMMKHREIGDYSYVKKLNPDEVKDDIEKARELLDAVRQYLKLDKT
jgi:hypothetical protein